jgi:hypothetical protein
MCCYFIKGKIFIAYLDIQWENWQLLGYGDWEEFWENGWANMTQVCFMADVGQEGEISKFFLPLESHLNA